MTAGATYFYTVIAMYPDGSQVASVPTANTLPQPAPPPVVITAAPAALSINSAPLTVAPAGAAPRTILGVSNLVPPTGVVVTGTPLLARVVWNTNVPPDSHVTYMVWRSDDGRPSTLVSPMLSIDLYYNAANIEEEYPNTGLAKRLRLIDQLPDPQVTYRYTVIAFFPDGRSAEAPAVTYISPPLLNPTGFTVTVTRQSGPTTAEVAFQWNAVSGAVQYRVDGTGLPNTGLMSPTRTVSAARIPNGAGTWRLTALYPGNWADYANGTVNASVIRVLPLPSQPWLTKPNGPGSPLLVQAPKYSGCYGSAQIPELNDVYRATGGACGNSDDSQLATAQSWRRVNTAWLALSDPMTGNPMVGLRRWWGVPLLTWDDPAQFPAEARYGNTGDLGVGPLQRPPLFARPGLVDTEAPLRH